MWPCHNLASLYGVARLSLSNFVAKQLCNLCNAPIHHAVDISYETNAPPALEGFRQDHG